MNESETARNISTLEYFKILQMEYILYEVRSKIYPFGKDREKFRNIMEYKKTKINDISDKNEIGSIFTNVAKKLDFLQKFNLEFLNGNIGTKKDKYFYYFIGSDFSFKGDVYKMLKYDFTNEIASLENESEIITVNFNQIKRIL